MIAAAAFTGLALFVYSGGPDGDTARICVSGPGGSWLYPLSAAETVRVAGLSGDTVVEIGGGVARIVSSPCRNQTCVASPPVGRHGQWIACLPNQVMVSVTGAPPAGGAPAGVVDGVTW
jgi:hypothetical protein